MHIRKPGRRPQTLVPDGIPVLSRGRHRNPRQGGCFMEMASWLAGERWSDHPSCTHPVLATLARQVNDRVDDPHRQLLTPMIPDVIGVTGGDPLVTPRLARACALAVLESRCPAHHGVAALALLRSEAAINRLEDRGTDTLSPEATRMLAARPEASTWAHAFSHRVGRRPRHGRAAERRAAKTAIGIAGSALQFAPGGADRLVALLGEAITICRAGAGRPASSTANQGARKA